jgi:hypothetical protein
MLPTHVADRDAASRPCASLPQRRERVGGLARLRDHDASVLVDDRIAVAVLGAVVDFDRDARASSRSGTCRPARVPRRAAGDDVHALDRASHSVGRDLHLVEEDLPDSSNAAE